MRLSFGPILSLLITTLFTVVSNSKGISNHERGLTYARNSTLSPKHLTKLVLGNSDTCIPSGCLPKGAVDCGDGTYCDEGEICVPDGCIPAGAVVCGDGSYCNKEEYCCDPESCCPN
ncbi:12787_t:CDS:2 [Funneliformis mosseae]|uniref:12787_t:CDS:1 n=1 Tax=Funneliformis mosseae TaxID=27381 RepID=A0A9N9DN95_FUNMO|nr:12787_t:CDS:2 [Funneliformis mosseae]